MEKLYKVVLFLKHLIFWMRIFSSTLTKKMTQHSLVSLKHREQNHREIKDTKGTKPYEERVYISGKSMFFYPLRQQKMILVSSKRHSLCKDIFLKVTYLCFVSNRIWRASFSFLLSVTATNFPMCKSVKNIALRLHVKIYFQISIAEWSILIDTWHLHAKGT